MAQDVDVELLNTILSEIFTTMLGLSISSTETVPEISFLGRACLCSISITGTWNGNVIVQCSDELARELGAGMFGMEKDAIEKAEVRDAMGEITNMIGGNLKKNLPGPSSLSLPNVMFGSDVSWKVPGPANIQIFKAIICEKILAVTVVKRAING
jgi:chemotaxis protein CheX